MRSRFGRASTQVSMAALLILGGAARAVAQSPSAAPDSSATPWPQVRFDGQLRLRGEADGRTAGSDPDFATLSRIRVGVEADLHEWIAVYVQLQDARAWGSETNTLSDGSADALDLHQGYADLGSGPAFTARLGRQVVSLADERLVGSVDWTNTGRSFDGARLAGESGGVSWTAFWMTIAERDSLLTTGLDPQLNQGENDDGWLIGGFASHRFGDVTAELTALFDRDAATDESYTANLRLHGRTGIALYEAAGAYQFGPDRSAWFASARAGMALGDATVAAQLDVLSGDDEVDDGEIHAFRTLYATNHRFYGYMDYFTAPGLQLDGAGLIDGMVRASWSPAADRSLRADLHRFSTTRERAGKRALGTELDVVGTWSPAAPANLQIGVGVFVPEDLATSLIPAFQEGDDTTWWGFAQLTLRWP